MDAKTARDARTQGAAPHLLAALVRLLDRWGDWTAECDGEGDCKNATGGALKTVLGECPYCEAYDAVALVLPKYRRK